MFQEKIQSALVMNKFYWYIQINSQSFQRTLQSKVNSFSKRFHHLWTFFLSHLFFRVMNANLSWALPLTWGWPRSWTWAYFFHDCTLQHLHRDIPDSFIGPKLNIFSKTEIEDQENADQKNYKISFSTLKSHDHSSLRILTQGIVTNPNIPKISC